MRESLASAVEDAIAPTRHGVHWGVSVCRNGIPEADVDASAVLRTASMGKVFLLAEVARRLEAAELDPGMVLSAAGVPPVRDSGLWQHFCDVPLTVSAAAVLVASVSDNLATNVLLAQVGLDSVQRMSAALGMPQTRMLDRIRDERTPDDPPGPSVGRAGDLAGFMHVVGTPGGLSDGWRARMRAWLALGVDLSMVASALGLDPLAHATQPPGLCNKTGTDVGIRADAGCLTVRGTTWSYAVIANWETAGSDPDGPGMVTAVLAAMRRIGESLWAAANDLP